MTNNHPITPTPAAWLYEGEPDFNGERWRKNWHVTTDEQVARFKAQPGDPVPLFRHQQPVAEGPTDEEIEEWADKLRAAHRPKPPSLKEQALKALDDISIASFEQDAANTIRHALEQLND